MTTTVRCFYHTGTTTAPVSASGGRFTSDSVMLVKQPYLERDSVTVNTGTPQSIDAAPAACKLLVVQVQEGRAAHMEINPPNRSTAADTGSPIVSGTVHLEFGPDWTASFLECEIV